MQVPNGYSPTLTPEHYHALYWIPTVPSVHNYSFFINNCYLIRLSKKAWKFLPVSMVLKICVVPSSTVHKAAAI